MYFEIVGEVTHAETFASGSSIREIARLRKFYGRGRWRKRKGIARVKLPDGSVRLAEALVGSARHWAQRVQDQTLHRLNPMKSSTSKFVVCLKNKGYEVSLEPRKIYQVVADPDGLKHGQLRIIDESGEDYLYPANYFVAIELPQPVRKAVLATA